MSAEYEITGPNSPLWKVGVEEGFDQAVPLLCEDGVQAGSQHVEHDDTLVAGVLLSHLQGGLEVEYLRLVQVLPLPHPPRRL